MRNLCVSIPRPLEEAAKEDDQKNKSDGINDDDLVLGEKKWVMTKQTHGLKKETAQLVENLT